MSDTSKPVDRKRLSLSWEEMMKAAILHELRGGGLCNVPANGVVKTEAPEPSKA